MVVVASIYPSIVNADKVLFFTPTRITMDDSSKVKVMSITNLSNISRAYKISFQDQVMTPEGVTASVDNFEYSAKRMLRFVPRNFVLKPGERQTIRIMMRVRPNTTEGEYHTHIRFLEDVSKRHKINPKKPGESASIAAPIAYEALIPAIISHGNINTKINMKSAKLFKGSKKNNYKINLILSRQGNGQGTAYIDTNYVAPNGKETIVTPRRTVYIYRELSERKKDYNFTIPAGLPKGGSIKVSLYDNTENDAVPVKELTFKLK